MRIDPATDLDLYVRRRDAEVAADKAVRKARTQLVIGDRVETYKNGKRDYDRVETARSVFFATLAMRLKLAPNWDMPTAATDGKSLFYNPEFLRSLKLEETIGVVAHEVLHVVFDHVGQMQAGGVDSEKANVAMDLVVDAILRDAKFTLPDCALFPGTRPKGNFPAPWADAIEKMKPTPSLTWKQYYALLPDLPPGSGGGQDPGGCGGVLPSGQDAASVDRVSADWKIAVAQAAESASRAGKLPAGLEQFIKEILEPKVDWRKELHDFVRSHAATQYTWLPPNRRFMAQGLYLPSVTGQTLAPGLIFVDASGSCWDAQTQSSFAGEMQAIAEQFGADLTIAYHDTVVQQVLRWSSQDGPLKLDRSWGGGGTDHAPCFQWLAEQPDQPEWIVVLSDMDTISFGKDPGVPVLWCRVGKCDAMPPFGRRIDLE